jgi:hypothetical protein
MEYAEPIYGGLWLKAATDTGLDECLEGAGITVHEDEILKEAAERGGMDPIDILKVILVEGYRAGRT